VNSFGTFPTKTSLAALGEQGNYSLTATAVETGSAEALTGSVSFLDKSNGNASWGSGAIGANTLALDFPLASTLNTTSSAALATGDFNGDGKPNLAIMNADNSISIFSATEMEHSLQSRVPEYLAAERRHV
jgi:hypothetical protein